MLAPLIVYLSACDLSAAALWPMALLAGGFVTHHRHPLSMAHRSATHPLEAQVDKDSSLGDLR